MEHKRNRNHQRDREEQEVDKILSFVSQRTLRQDLLQFPRRHQAACDRQSAQNDFHREHRHHEAGNCRCAQVELGRAYQGHAEGAKSVAERGSLRNRGHRNSPQRHTDDRAQHQRDRDQVVIMKALAQQCADNRQHHPDFARPDAVARCRR